VGVVYAGAVEALSFTGGSAGALCGAGGGTGAVLQPASAARAIRVKTEIVVLMMETSSGYARNIGRVVRARPPRGERAC
jgi:hypothetical protein